MLTLPKPSEGGVEANSFPKCASGNADVEKPIFPQGPFYTAQIPNLITCVVIASGCTLMVSTRPEVSIIAAAIGLAADMVDGFAARSLKATSKFGAAFDQLADLCCFGIGPAVFFIRKMTEEFSYSGLLAGYVYMACSAARIARELVVHDISKPQFFVGIPTNLACPILLCAVYDCPWPGACWLKVWVLVLSVLMVMPVEIPKDLGTGLLKQEPHAPSAPPIKREMSKPIFPQGPIYKAQVPNLVTCIVVACGCTLMGSTSMPGFTPELSLLAAAIGLAADMIDGFLARYLNATSKFGAAFDQLADLTCFGIGPAIFFILHQTQQGSLIAGYIYMVCAAGRIARELVVHNIGKPTFFVGIPTNLACPILLLAVYVCPHAWWLPILVCVLSALMVMPVPIPKDLGTGLLKPASERVKAN